MTGQLQNKIALITGASRGIGQSIAERFAREGALVYAAARTEGCLDQWAEGINREASGRILSVYFDMKDSAGMKQAVMRVKKEQGRIDVLVNNAGVSYNDRLGMISGERTKEMFEVNVFGLLELSQMVATRFMMKQGGGSIVNLASIVGAKGSPGQIAYSASKGAVIALTKSMAKELAAHHVRVNAVAPGLTDTGMLEIARPEELEKRIARIPMGRIAEPADIANAVLFLASDQSAYITGQILGVDGGAVM